MKKLVSVLFALLLVGSFAFAEVNVGAWGRFTFVPAASYDGGDNEAFTSPSWDAGGARVGVNFSGTSDNVGFNVNFDANGDVISVGDQGKIWVKFNDMVKLQGGRVQQDVLRGKIGGSSLVSSTGAGHFSFQGTAGEDDIFKRFNPDLGVVLDVTPAEGVYIGAALNAGAYADQPILTENMFKTIQLGAGYMIADLGHARIQYIGGLDDKPAFIQVAFAYTGLEGLLVDAGLKYNIGEDAVKGAQSQFAMGAKYTMDALSVIGRGLVSFGEDASDDAGLVTNDDLGYKVSADVAYTVADPLTVGLEVIYSKRADPYEMTIIPYGKLGYGNGHFKAGFIYDTKDTTGDDAISSWALPLQLQYSF